MQDPGRLVWIQVSVYVFHTDGNVSAFIIPVHYTDETPRLFPIPHPADSHTDIMGGSLK